MAPEPFQYALLRIVPRIDRGECVNAGVVVFCRTRRFLGARVALDEARLVALAPDLAIASLRPHLDAIIEVAAGRDAGGPIASLSQSERFHWLVAPSSTVIQPSAVHTGLCEDPDAMLEHLLNTLVC